MIEHKQNIRNLGKEAEKKYREEKEGESTEIIS